MSKVKTVTRRDWNARQAKHTIPQGPVSEIVVHTTVTYDHPASASVDTVARSWKGIQNYHMDTKGWYDIAYSFGFDRAGRCYVGRGSKRKDAATEGKSGTTLSFVTIGNTDTKRPSFRQRAAMVKKARELKREGKLVGRIKVTGHRRYSTKGKTCPGRKFTDAMLLRMQRRINK